MNPVSLAGHVIELLEILQQDSRPADYLIDRFFRSRRYLGSHDRRALAETVYGILRHRRLLQALIARVQPQSVNDAGWWLAAFKLHVEKAELAAVAAALTAPGRRPAALSLADLRQLAAQSCGDFADNPAVTLSFPDWLVHDLQQQRGKAEALRLLQALNQPPPLTIRVNTLKTTRTACQQELQRRGLPSTPTPLSPFGLQLSRRTNLFALDLFRAGWFEVQDEGSQLISLLVDPKPTWRIADVCAGGGGKTLHLAGLMKNRGEIFAFDVSAKRLANLQRRSRRSGAHNIRVQVVPESELPGHLLGRLDAILIDAPCSGSGVLRRNPDAKWKITAEMVTELATKQLHLLRHYAALLKPGGRLVYATCSVLAQENERVVEAFLAGHPGFQTEEAAAILQHYRLGGLAAGHLLHLSPHQHGCDGFFAAVLQRRDQAPA
ncbi:MAG: RsmB/NOP family class I SAM-dependent RNA methyltransferase [candidate division KSB1 bacterium]|nr:RsmB/NOP family class I SAM-dependent RNA methyltransferase [candidate division KSB1 bacterium]MDZ7276509.1 RsmB/NOP family class I SAM-dependent RNA methyltransferase [candidate division KSB1 bacterium]MDZ7286710.1 RsmB/NOP family class I SAM-dependent RNA methyltransferase [candidate division KSB1 bacterium]MDZ7300279.1 RsmB/NOP family class I SAM-dependent RNA methyltransferase [candidate division KSB1 bacterium]MDZ7307880.1 RsmB/NOP family class I SAM-dependent RNA methyltransferase [can